MNLLKSLFITSFITFASAVTVYAVMQLLSTNTYLLWTGVLLSAAPFALMIMHWMLFQKNARTSGNLSVLNVLGIVGVLLTAWQASTQSAQGASLALTFSLISWVCLLIYIYWYSRFDERKGAKFKVGKKLPSITLSDAQGNMVKFDEKVGKKSILMFFRGNWCPLCVAQVKEIVDLYQELDAMGVRVALISPQSEKQTQILADKFKVNFEFYSDTNNRAAKALGIDSPNGLPMGLQVMGYDSDTVLPTVIITDEKNTVLWSHETDNYRVRPEPEIFLKVLRDLQQ